MCFVVFQKIFRKIFSGVWKMLQGKDKPISTPDKTQIDARRLRSRRAEQTHHDRARQTHHDRAVDRNLAKHRAASRDRDRREGEIAIDGAISRSVDHDRGEGEIAIDGAISRSVDRDLASTAPIAIGAKARSRSRIAIDGAGACERRRLVLLPLANGADPRSRTARSASPSLSLSLSLRNSFEVKIGTEIHFRNQSPFFFQSTEINFRKILFSGPTKHPYFRKSISGNDFHPKQTQP